MLTYHKIFKANPSIYLSNSEPVFVRNEDFLNRLISAKNTEELQKAVKKKWLEIIADYMTDTGFVYKIFNTLKPVAKACIDTAIEASVSDDKQGMAKSVLSINVMNKTHVGDVK